MQLLQAGQNIALTETSLTLTIDWQVPSLQDSQIDVSAYMLGDDNKVRSDDDFIFYNQPSAKEGCLSLSGQGCEQHYRVDLAKVPADVMKIAFAIAIDTQATFSAAQRLVVSLQGLAEFAPATANMQERALILGQLYRHNGKWKFRAMGAGFNAGLGPLAESFGVVIDGPSPEPAATPAQSASAAAAPAKAVDLEKVIEQQAPRLVDLAKPAAVSLAKNNLENVRAKVAFVLDCSGSMSFQFSKGNVQAVLDRIAVLAVQFDDDAAFDFWAFAQEFKKCEDVSLDNLDGYIERLTHKEKKGFFSGFKGIVEGLGIGNNEPPVMRDVIDFYKGSELPAYVVFITDGGVHQSSKIKTLMKEASSEPVFWQFVGLGGSNYGVLEELDDMGGRVVDNADFFQIDDFAKVRDSELYDRLLNEFPGWLKAAKAANVL
ncbi:MAG: vWA domain-containing protein [Pseudomonadales bacterium]